MWLRCALVSLTLATFPLAPYPLSFADEEQPATRSSAAAAAAFIAIESARIGRARELGLVPPAAAERLEQRDGVGETVGLGLDRRKAGLLIRLVGVQHGEIGR